MPLYEDQRSLVNSSVPTGILLKPSRLPVSTDTRRKHSLVSMTVIGTEERLDAPVWTAIESPNAGDLWARGLPQLPQKTRVTVLPDAAFLPYSLTFEPLKSTLAMGTRML